MKRIIFLVTMLFCCLIGYSQLINEGEAKKLAEKYYVEYALNGCKPSQRLRFNLVYDCTDSYIKSVAADASYYYIFDVSHDKGFIIISGDHRAVPVIGFATEGGFSYNDGNGFFKEILHRYGEQLKAIVTDQCDSIPYDDQPPVRELSYRADPDIPAVLPLLGKTAWGQRDPFNRMCPYFPAVKAKALTGCVATAIGQIMRFYQWPITGKGTHTYTTRTLNLSQSADFSAHSFQWDKMKDTYDRDCSNRVGEPVSKLMHLIGVAAELDYKERTTSGNGRLLIKGMVDYFGYSPDIKMQLTDNYRDIDFRELLRSELQSGRPVFIGSGINRKYHSYVCDGYNEQGLFHLNFGWKGRCNGYYAVGSLRKNISDNFLSLPKQGDRTHVIFDIKPGK